MASGQTIAKLIDALPVVADNSDRDTRFPSPDQNQRVENLSLGVIQRFGASGWVTDEAFEASLGYINVQNAPYNAVGDGVADDTAAITAAIAAAAATVGGAVGATVLLPTGTYLVSSQITLPNRVALRGSNGRGTIIKASAAHPGPWLFDAVNGSSSMFDSWLLDLTLDCNSVAGLGGLLAEAWQENSGLRRVIIQNFRTSGIRFQTGFGGASHCLLNNIELFGSTSGATYGIDLQQISAVGGFMLSIIGATIAGGAAASLTAGINVVKDSVIASSVHFENCTVGLLLDGLGSSDLHGVTGAVTVTDLVKIAGTFTGRLAAHSLMPRSATNTLNNAVLSELFTTSIARYIYPDIDETGISGDRGDTSVSLVVGTDAPIQRFATILTANRTVTLTTGLTTRRGARFRVVRSGLGAFTLDVGGLKTIPNSTAAFVDVAFTGAAWVLTGYGTL